MHSLAEDLTPPGPRLRAGGPGGAPRDRDGVRRLGRGGRARRPRADDLPVPPGRPQHPHGRAHRGGHVQGRPRRQDDLLSERRHHAAARGAGGGRRLRARRHLRGRERLGAAGRQAGDRQVAHGGDEHGRRGPLSQPRLPHLQLVHRVRGRDRRALRLRGRRRALHHRHRRDRAAHHAAHPPPHPQRPAQPDGRRVHLRGARPHRRDRREARPPRAQRRGLLRRALPAARASRSSRARAWPSAPSSSTPSARSTR